MEALLLGAVIIGIILSFTFLLSAFMTLNYVCKQLNKLDEESQDH